MMYQGIRGKQLACIATVAAVVFTTGPLLAGTVQDGSWGGTSPYQRLVYDTYARQEGESYSSVGMVNLDLGNSSYHSGTGTLIGNRWVLTAAHVVSDWDNFSFTINGQNYKAKRWFVHKGYDGSTYGNGRDIALIKLGRPVQGVAKSKVAPRTESWGLTGKEVTTVGYGGSGTGLTGYGIPPDIAPTLSDYNWSISVGTKRAGHNRIDVKFFGQNDWNLGQSTGNRIFTYDFDPEPIWSSQIGVNWIETEDEFLNGPGYNDTPVTREWSTTPGDSGGPTFNDKGEIVGITSWGTVVWYQVDDNWYRAAGFYQGLNLDGERAGAKNAPADDAADVDNFYSKLGFTNAALYANWIKRVIRLANTPGMGKKLLDIVQLGSTAKGGIYFSGVDDYDFFGSHTVSNLSLRDFLGDKFFIPEPAALMLLSAGTLLVLRRRRA